MKRILLLLALVLVCVTLSACCGNKDGESIRVGGLFDLSGKTRGVSREYAEGAIDYLRWVNEMEGGVNSRKIDFHYRDYGYVISRANTCYDEFKALGVIAILGWGTGDTEALSPRVAADRIPYISGSYSENMADPRKAPYNFIASVSYSDQARIALRFIKREAMKEGQANPSVSFVYNDTGFGRSPFFPDAELFARQEAVEVRKNVVIPLTGEGAREQLQAMTSEWAIVQQTSVAALAVLRARKELGLPVKLIFLNWGMDENVVAQAGAAANGAYATIAYGLWENPEMELLHRINAKYHPEIKSRSNRYIQGYIAARILVEGLRRTTVVSGENLKNSLENLHNVDIGAGQMVNFSSLVHKPASSLKIYQVVEGRLSPTKEVIAVDQKIWEKY